MLRVLPLASIEEIAAGGRSVPLTETVRTVLGGVDVASGSSKESVRVCPSVEVDEFVSSAGGVDRR